MKSLKYITLLLFVIFIDSLIAQNYRLQYIDAMAGLPQADVKSIAQDHKGFLWITTNDGLARYDGYEFKSYSVIEDGIPTSLTRTLQCDAEGNMWIGTLDRGLFMYDSYLERFENISQKLQSNGDDKHLFIFDIAIDKSDGSIWITKEFGLLSRISIIGEGDQKQYKIKHYPIPELDKHRVNSTSIIADDSGHIIFIKMHKVYVYNRLSDSFELLLPNTLDQIIQLTVKDDRVYYLKYGKLHSILFDGSEYRLESKLTVRHFLIDSDNVIWLFTDDGIYYKKDNYHKEEKLCDSSHVVLCSQQSAQGDILIGLLRRGLLVITEDRVSFPHYMDKYSSEAIFEDSDGNLIVGTIDDGLKLLQSSELQKYFIRDIDLGLSSQNIFSICENTLRDEFILCRSGIACAIKREDLLSNAKSQRIIKIDLAESVRSVTVDSTFMWFSSYSKGLMRYDASNYKLLSHFSDITPQLPLPSKIVRNTYLDRDKNLWVATSKGLVRVAAKDRFSQNPSYKIYQHHTDNPMSISYDYIIPITQDSRGYLWVGTLGGGVNAMRFDKDGDIIENKIYNTNNGLSNNSIKGIVIDDQDMVWVTTNRGVNRIDPQNGKIKLYTTEHGLQSYEFSELSCVKLQSGEIAVGGVNGLNIFNPANIIAHGELTPVVITNFTLLNKPIKPGESFSGEQVLRQSITESKEIDLKYKLNSFSFEFSSFELVNPQSVKYSYTLEGFDHDWSTSLWSNRTARYTNIPPGEYTFKVRAQNNDGEWSQSTDLKVRVHYPPMLSPIAFCVYILLIIMVVFMTVKESRRRQQERTKLLLMQQEKQQLRELSKMKLNFLTNISHEFRTPLTLIITPLQLLRSSRNIGREKMDRYLDIIAHNSNILYGLISEFLNITKQENESIDINLSKVDIVDLTNKTFMQFEVWAEQRSINIRSELPLCSIMVMGDMMKLEEIIYNLLSNAIKYTPIGGEICLSLKHDGDFVCVSIMNTGEGITSEEQNHIFERYFKSKHSEDGVGIGLSLTKNLIELHGGELSFASVRGETTFTFTLPLDGVGLCQELEDTTTPKQSTQTSNDGGVTYGCKILIVDDNPTIVSLLNDLLSSNYTVFKANNAMEAYELAQKHLPSLIISDVLMGEVSGVELCKQLKESPKTSHIPIILLTANASKEAQMEGMQQHADAYVLKPFDNDILLSQIKSLLANRESIVAKFNLSGNGELASLYQREDDHEFVNEVIKIIEDNISNSEFSVEMLSTQLGIHKVTLNKRLKKVVDKTANAFIRSVRMKYAAAMLVNGNYTIAETTYAIGLNDLRHFRECFKKEFGVLPSEYAASTPINKTDD